MKKLLYVLLCFFLLIDIVLAVIYFWPSQLSIVPQTKQNHSIEITAETFYKTPRLQNVKYLNTKLNQLGFWEDKKINYYSRNIEKVTVNHLIISLAKEPQLWGKQMDKTKDGRVVLSYGQKYVNSTQTMTVYIHAVPEYFSDFSSEGVYGAAILQALFDLTYKYPKNQKDYDSNLLKFAADYYQNPENQKIIKFGIL